MTSVPTNRISRRLWSLDVFRGLCALTVFLNHWHLWSDFGPVGQFERFIKELFSNTFQLFASLTWNTGGNHPAVIGFFVLSGFCIHASQCQSDSSHSPVNWRLYFLNRARRILPVYWCAALIGIGFVVLHTRLPSVDPLLSFHAEAETPLDFVLRLSASSGLYPREVLAGNYTLNTVATELIIYSLYPVFLACARRNAWKSMAVAALLGQLAIIQMIPRWSPFWVYWSPPMMGAFWYSGALAAKWFFAQPRRTSGLACIACWMAFLAARTLPGFYGRTLLLQLLWCAVCVQGLLWLAGLEHANPSVGRHSCIRALRCVGLVSYSLYAVHTPVIMITTWVLIKCPFLGPNYSLQLLFTLISTTLATLTTYFLVERRYFRSRIKGDSDVSAQAPAT